MPAAVHQRRSSPERWSSWWWVRQSGTVYSSLTLRPSARAWVKRRWCGSQGFRPQNRQGCEATNLRWALSRYRRGSPIGSMLLSMPGGLVERSSTPLLWPLRGATAVDRELGDTPSRSAASGDGCPALRAAPSVSKAERRRSNASSTTRASAAVSLFFTGRAVRAHWAASAADPTLATSCTSWMYELVAQDGRAIGIEGRPPAIVAIPTGLTRSLGGGEYGGCPDVGGASRLRSAVQVGGIEVVLAGDANQGEQRVPARVGQRGPHSVRGRGVGEPADRPIRRDPFSRGVGEHRGQADGAARGVDGSRLNRGDLLLAKGF